MNQSTLECLGRTEKIDESLDCATSEVKENKGEDIRKKKKGPSERDLVFKRVKGELETVLVVPMNVYQ